MKKTLKEVRQGLEEASVASLSDLQFIRARLIVIHTLKQENILQKKY